MPLFWGGCVAISEKGLEAPSLILDILQRRHRVRREKGFIDLKIKLPQDRVAKVEIKENMTPK